MSTTTASAISSAAGPASFFTHDHRACDAQWNAVETCVDAGDDAGAAAAWSEFERAMRRHFDMEEDVLFPELERATGMTGGPTAVMRSEHTQMRSLLDQMSQCAAGGDYESLADHGDTLLMLIQQHNIKEEGVLYPMAEQRLGAQWPALAERLARY